MENIINVSSVRTDGGTQPRAAIFQNVVDDYAEAMKAGAIFPPIVVFFDGTDYWLGDGFHRHAGAQKAGLAGITADVRQGTRRDAVLFSVGANALHGLRRTNEDKRRAVTVLLTDDEWQKWSFRKIARACAVGEFLVRTIHKELSAFKTQIEKPAVREVERGGVVYEQDTKNIGNKPEVRASSEPAPVVDVDMPANDNHRAVGTGENEWYTPAQHVTLARQILGEIDVDPASNPIAQETVRAKAFFTEETNGLDKEWLGNVWLNPPYAQPAIAHFADKILSEVANGNTKQAIVLTHNYTDTSWFQKLAGGAKAICFTRGRIRFVSPEGKLASPTQGQTFFYFGPNPKKFCKTFGEIGICYGAAA